AARDVGAREAAARRRRSRRRGPHAERLGCAGAAHPGRAGGCEPADRSPRRGIRCSGPHRLARCAFPPLPHPGDARTGPIRPDRSPMITPATLHRTVSAALEEDAPWGDITSTALLPADAHAAADLIAREAGVFSGGEVFAAAFTLPDPAVP